MTINGRTLTRAQALRLLEGLRAGEEALWEGARVAGGLEESQALLGARNELAWMVGDLREEIRSSAEAEREDEESNPIH